MIWRKANEEFKLKNLKPTMTYGGGSLMIWGCISSKGVGELVFTDGILNKNKSWIKYYKIDFRIIQRD